MDPVYNYKIAKAAIAATMHYATANPSTLSASIYQQEAQVSFFPNPTKSTLYINKGTLTDSSYKVSIVDVQGKIVLSQQFETTNLLEQINVSQLPKGIYMAILETKSQSITKKIVIE